jgi:subtilisin family serine protease
MQCATRVDPNGLFSPKFTCFGPGVSVCAPGVAIVSSVPPNNYAVADGTSVAAAHITGLAALVLAHHPDFQGPFRARNSDRVDRLFQIIRSSAQPVNLGDPRRTGFGLPDVLAALGLVAWPATMMAGAGIPLATRIFGPFVPFGTNSAILYGALGAYSPVQGVPPVPVGVW